jgi:hypothetical protein
MMDGAVSIRVEAWGIVITFSIADGTVVIEQPKKVIGKPATLAEATIDKIPVAPTPAAAHVVAPTEQQRQTVFKPIA